MATMPARITVKKTNKGARVLSSARNQRGVHYFVDEVLVERGEKSRATFRQGIEAAILTLMPEAKE